ncbi:MAG: hypothetical protein IPJ77_22995 [Planctomycetes bacterium]|nr:hypothetical protein [Planctomycetota bacterium]
MLFASSCATNTSVDGFARFDHATDLDTYSLKRVGVLPFTGTGLEASTARDCAEAFASALAREANFEVRVLDPRDLEEVPKSETFRRGWTHPATPIELAKRYGLDAVVIGDVRRAQWFPPQRLDLSVDLIAVETGVPIWSGSVDLDSGDERVRTALKRWYRHERRGDDARGETWELYLLSPRLFFEFAAAQTARGF